MDGKILGSKLQQRVQQEGFIATAYVMFIVFWELKSLKKRKKHHSTNGSTTAGLCWVKLRNDAS